MHARRSYLQTQPYSQAAQQQQLQRHVKKAREDMMLIDCEIKQERDSREGVTQLLSKVHDAGSGGSEGEEGVHGKLKRCPIDAVLRALGVVEHGHTMIESAERRARRTTFRCMRDVLCARSEQAPAHTASTRTCAYNLQTGTLNCFLTYSRLTINQS